MSSYSSNFTPAIAKALLQIPTERAGHLYEQHLGGMFSNERATVAGIIAKIDLQHATTFIDGLAKEHRQHVALRFLSDSPVHDIEPLSTWIASEAMEPFADQAADQLAKNLIRRLGPSQRQSIAAKLPSDHPLATALQRGEHAFSEALSGDPKTYVDWISKEPYADSVDTLVLERLSDSDPERQLDFLAVSNVGGDGYLANALEALSLTDTDTATRWALTQSDQEIQETAVASIAKGLASHDLDTAFEWVAQHRETPAESIATNAVLSQWAYNDPEAAAIWTQDQMADHPELASLLMKNWTRYDPVRASQWLSEQLEGSSKDAGITAFVRAYNEPDHAKEVLTWAATIQDAQRRRALLLETFATWQHEPNLIEQGLVHPHLNPEDAAAIRDAAERDFEEPTNDSDDPLSVF